ncbi:hypothetical protein AB7M22_002942 [Pseudomonas sp. ADAK2 TE3594]
MPTENKTTEPLPSLATGAKFDSSTWADFVQRFSAQLQDEDDETLYCTTILPGTDDVSDEKFVQALNIIRPPSRSVMHMTTTHADGSKTLTAII